MAGAFPPTSTSVNAPTSKSVWMCLRVRSRFEFQVAADLERMRIEVFLPTWNEQVLWSDRTRTITRPLFPGYVFARTASPLAVFAVLATRGVVQILPNSHKPAEITDQEIDTVRRACESGLTLVPCEFAAGDSVLIESGPLAGVSGVVVKTRGALNVVVGIEILRRAVNVTLDAATLVKRVEESK